MRGTRLYDCFRHVIVGIIPAYAGNTDRTRSKCSVCRDHPRVCGEHSPISTRRTVSPGSSPRMRGTPKRVMVNTRSNGIIPAYAGNTVNTPGGEVLYRDHPRVCGEHAETVKNDRTLPGSSPRMRGTLDLNRGPLGNNGIIPAYAGNTEVRRPRALVPQDHPRVCGEHTKRL